MAARTLPGIGLLGGRSAGEDGWASEMNTNLIQLSALSQLSSKSRVTALPGSPTNGDIYIVPSGADLNKIAIRDNGAWVLLVPQAGWRAYLKDELITVIFDGTVWRTSHEPFDIDGFTRAPGASTVILDYIFARAVTFPDDFAGSQCKSGTAATASAVFIVKRNTTQIGTITFAAGSASATFLTSGTTTETFAVGDIITLTCPASIDSTLASVTFTFAGTR